MTLILSGTNGVSDIDGDASTPAVRGTDANSGIFFGADTVGVSTGGSEKVSVGASAVVVNDGGADVDFRVESDTVENALFVDGASGNVGIGMVPTTGWRTGALADRALQIQGNGVLRGQNNANLVELGVNYYINSSNDSIYIASDEVSRMRQNDGIFVFESAASGTAGNTITWSERMRIDSSGNLLVGRTDTNTANPGINLTSSGAATFTRDSDDVVTINRKTNNGTLVAFRQDNTQCGLISVSGGSSNEMAFVASAGKGILINGNGILPSNNTGTGGSDNTTDLGQFDVRYDDVYATNGTIQTSDANEKQDIEALSEAEARVAVAAKGLLKKYRWKSAVAEKGDDARIHFGIIAQDLKAAFEAEGLDAGRYAMFIHSEWWETQTEVPAVEAQEAVYKTQTDEEGNEVQVLVSEAVEGKQAYTRTDTYETEAEAPEGAVRKERMGIRYNELLAFIIAAI